MTTSVDVLAVMEQAACALRIDARHEQGEDMEIARAALAELFDLGAKLEVGMIRPSDENRQQVYTFQRGDAEAFFAALARVKGA